MREALHPGEPVNGDVLDVSEDYYLRPQDPLWLKSPLRPGLVENKDYKVLNKKSGKLIHKLFGGKPVVRKAKITDRSIVPVIYPPLVPIFPKHR